MIAQYIAYGIVIVILFIAAWMMSHIHPVFDGEWAISGIQGETEYAQHLKKINFSLSEERDSLSLHSEGIESIVFDIVEMSSGKLVAKNNTLKNNVFELEYDVEFTPALVIKVDNAVIEYRHILTEQ